LSLPFVPVYGRLCPAEDAPLIKRRLFDAAAVLLEAPARHAVRQITAPMSRATPAEE
jgi:hypothetical protein